MTDEDLRQTLNDLADQLRAYSKVMIDQEKRIIPLDAHSTAFSMIAQTMSVAMQERGAISRDELAVAFQGAVEYAKRTGSPQEVAEAIKTIQRGLLQELPAKRSKPPPLSH